MPICVLGYGKAPVEAVRLAGACRVHVDAAYMGKPAVWVGCGSCRIWESPPCGGLSCEVWVRRRATLPHPVGCSTIAVPGLSFRVRNGTGRLPWAVTAARLYCVILFHPRVGVGGWFGDRMVDAGAGVRMEGTGVRCGFVLMLVSCDSLYRLFRCACARDVSGGGRLRPLVPVGSTPCGASTSGLSTTWSHVGSAAPSKGCKESLSWSGLPA